MQSHVQYTMYMYTHDFAEGKTIFPSAKSCDSKSPKVTIIDRFHIHYTYTMYMCRKHWVYVHLYIPMIRGYNLNTITSVSELMRSWVQKQLHMHSTAHHMTTVIHTILKSLFIPSEGCRLLLLALFFPSLLLWVVTLLSSSWSASIPRDTCSLC